MLFLYDRDTTTRPQIASVCNRDTFADDINHSFFNCLPL
jgi:hypothetical protein